MIKIIMFICFAISTFSNGNSPYINKTSKNETIRKYEEWQDELLKMQLKEIERKIMSANSLSVLTAKELDILYKLAEYKDYVETAGLKRDLIRAQIYYYYHRGYRRYYYYDINYNPIFIN